ncbi:MAG: thiamine phosphate synthase, partial [Phycisphaerae bacterium]|nr:thiamine phosphate synthase [Phycisphaerae bacterium]
MSAVARVMDANANRAREALRVLEDAARLALDDAALSSQLKDIRHALQGALAALPVGWLEANRNTAHDVGRTVKGEHELHRADYRAVVIAAGKRLGEALRSLEECMKTVQPSASAEIERLRYRAYEVEQALVLRLGSGARAQWRVCVLLTESLCARP